MAEKYRLPVSINDWKHKYDAVIAIKNNAQRNIVLVEAKHLWKCRFLSLNFPGVDGNNSSSNDGIFSPENQENTRRKIKNVFFSTTHFFFPQYGSKKNTGFKFFFGGGFLENGDFFFNNKKQMQRTIFCEIGVFGRANV